MTDRMIDLLDAATRVQNAAAATSSATSALPLIETRHMVAPRITERGYRKGQSPANRGKRYPPTPPKPQEVQAILDAIWRPGMPIKRHRIAKRNRALIVILWRAGLRIHEALLLLEDDIDFDHCMITIRRGKGGKRGVVGIDRRALVEVREWIDVRAEFGFTHDQPLFCVIEGETKGGPLNQAYVRTKLHEAARQAGIRKRVAPHQLRHACAVELAQGGEPIWLVSRQLRHSNISTTSTYLAGISPEEVIAAMAGREW